MGRSNAAPLRILAWAGVSFSDVRAVCLRRKCLSSLVEVVLGRTGADHADGFG